MESENEGKTIIEVQGVTKVFYPARTFGAWLRAPWQRGQPVTALHDLSLTIKDGELCCLMGSNGAGKTTLLKILTGLVLPTSGTVRLDGHAVRHHSPPAVRSQIGFASSDRPGFYDRLTGWQNLEFFAALYGLSRDRARHRMQELLQLLEVDAPDQRYQEYSSGMKQRLLLARALLHDPAILLLDEPTRSLDPVQTAKLHELIEGRLHQDMGKTILLSTHQVWEAEDLAERIVILHRGVIRGCGTKKELAGAESLRTVIDQWCR